MLIQSFKFVGSIFGAGVCWLADAVSQHSDEIPDWVDRYGIPVAFLFLTIYAIRALFSINQNLQKAIIEAKDKEISNEEKKTALSQAIARELIDATHAQTNEFTKLSEAVKGRPCFAERDGFPYIRTNRKTTVQTDQPPPPE